MTTAWTLPTSISQYVETDAEDIHISWDDTSFNNLTSITGRALGTTKPLYHIARSPKHDLKTKTYFLKLGGFRFEDIPNVISGIEVRLSSKRYGRITDETIQLSLNDELVGDNKATLMVSPIKTYGGENDTWGINPDDVLEPSFGIIIRLQSHPNWPHRDGAQIDAVEIRIH